MALSGFHHCLKIKPQPASRRGIVGTTMVDAVEGLALHGSPMNGTHGSRCGNGPLAEPIGKPNLPGTGYTLEAI
jgi:hypothetical protein